MANDIELKNPGQQYGYENEGFKEDEVQSPENESHKEYQNNEKLNFGDSNTQQNTITITKALKSEQSKNDAKEEWGGRMEFLMACIANSVGLGNVWRFSFTAYENGGGAFLIPYIIVLLLVGKPFYYLEGLLGQFTGKSCTSSWEMVPAMRGLGFGQIIAGFIVLSYYCSLMALTLYYFISSFQSILPWSYCREEWQNECISMKNTLNSNETTLANFSSNSGMSSAELYFRKIVLKEIDSIDDGIGIPSWSLALCLFFSWLTIFGIMSRGVKSSGKIAYFLAIFPYIVMIILLIRAVTLKGAVNGILFFVTPQWNALLQPKVWYAAITQCFFSLGVCFGPIIAYSSHNNFAHKIDRDVMIVTTLDTFTSLLAGCTIFGILGNLAHESGSSDISKVVRGGTGLAFISYPDALSRFAVVPQLFSALFFFMMFVLGTGSAMALFQAANGIVEDKFPNMKQWKRVLCFAVLGFLVGIIYITPGGQWFVTLMDYYGGTFVAIVVGVTEMITVFWIYGLYNFLNDVEFMLGTRPSFYWRLCWFAVTPLLMIVILAYTIVIYEPPKYNGAIFPNYAYVIGWIVMVVGISQIFIWMIIEIIKIRKNKKISFLESVKTSFSPSEENWGPRDQKKREEWKEFIAERKFRRQRSIFETCFK